MSAPRPPGDTANVPLTVEPLVSFHPTVVGKANPPPWPDASRLSLFEEPAIWPNAERLTQ